MIILDDQTYLRGYVIKFLNSKSELKRVYSFNVAQLIDLQVCGFAATIKAHIRK